MAWKRETVYESPSSPTPVRVVARCSAVWDRNVARAGQPRTAETWEKVVGITFILFIYFLTAWFYYIRYEAL